MINTAWLALLTSLLAWKLFILCTISWEQTNNFLGTKHNCDPFVPYDYWQTRTDCIDSIFYPIRDERSRSLKDHQSSWPPDDPEIRDHSVFRHRHRSLWDQGRPSGRLSFLPEMPQWGLGSREQRAPTCSLQMRLKKSSSGMVGAGGGLPRPSWSPSSPAGREERWSSILVPCDNRFSRPSLGEQEQECPVLSLGLTCIFMSCSKKESSGRESLSVVATERRCRISGWWRSLSRTVRLCKLI